MKRLKQKKGETLVEALISILVIVIAFMILTGAVAASARINGRVEAKNAVFGTSENSTVEVSTYSVASDVSVSKSVSVKLYQDTENGYYYYD